MEQNIAVWENEGGSLIEGIGRGMTGSVSQIEWAERIRAQVNDEFDRVAKALQAVAMKQSDEDRLSTFAIIRILDEKREEVLGNDKAGYFIRDWQELRDQVRKMVTADPRYKAIKPST